MEGLKLKLTNVKVRALTSEELDDLGRYIWSDYVLSTGKIPESLASLFPNELNEDKIHIASKREIETERKLWRNLPEEERERWMLNAKRIFIFIAQTFGAKVEPIPEKDE
jgi:phage pi2 protein 07